MSDPRIGWRDPNWAGKRRKFIIAVSTVALLMIVLFACNISYLYGSLYHSNNRVSALQMLAVDYDGGLIGEALLGAYSALKGDKFPTINFATVAQYPSIADVQKAVCKGTYWGAVVSQSGASARLSAAIGGGSAASSYNASDALIYIYNGARYSSVALGDVTGNLETLVGASASVYHNLNGTQALGTLNSSSQAAGLALLNPITASSINLQVFTQGGRPIYNTITLVLPIIQQFFFLMGFNNVSASFGIFGSLKSSHAGIIRMLVSIVYTFLASLGLTGYIWGFRETWDVNGVQFVLTWMTFWLYMHINFTILDAATAFIPMSFIAFFVLTWIITNVSSAIYPFELSAGFYRWGYALPAHEIYQVLIQIWSRGCNNQLYRALPILFSWEILGLVLAVAGNYKRNAAARKDLLAAEEKNQSDASKDDTLSRQADERDEIIARIESKAAGPSMQIPFMGYIFRTQKGKSSLGRQNTV